MKTIAIGAMIASLAIGTAFAQGAAYDAPLHPADVKHNSVCLWTYLIDHTSTLDPSTILFHMRNGKIWKNTLPVPCPALKFHGFSFLTQDEYVCSNMQSIAVIETHEACMLGAFEPYVPAPKEKSAQDRL